ncbi:SseB family protein [Symbioplanes lichenis]|uniref:SseB family protein n=1 Tax=Symbioplanes lichenis TaxID=1629072 RepID=UPI0027386668|nr:SseB family protein [Actinoplanes lichenis]
MTEWVPVTAAERALLAAGQDPAALLAALVTGPLLMPVSPAAAAGHEPAGWATGTYDGVTHVLAFTSPQAIAACLPGQPVTYRTDSVPSLVANWPDPSWRLAVNVRLPIGLILDSADLAALPDLSVPGEAPLRAAVEARDENAVTAAMLRAELIVPITAATRDLGDPDFSWPRGPEGIAVYTSEERMRQAVGEADFIAVTSLQLTTNWPLDGPALLLNPGTPLAVAIAGSTVRELATWFGELRTAMSPERSQLVIAPMYVSAYLDHGYDRASGQVHRPVAGETPLALYERVGLLGEGSPFQPDDDWVVVLRFDGPAPAEPSFVEPSFVVPDGASLHRIAADGGEVLVAVFSERRWVAPSS